MVLPLEMEATCEFMDWIDLDDAAVSRGAGGGFSPRFGFHMSGFGFMDPGHERKAFARDWS